MLSASLNIDSSYTSLKDCCIFTKAGALRELLWCAPVSFKPETCPHYTWQESALTPVEERHKIHQTAQV